MQCCDIGLDRVAGSGRRVHDRVLREDVADATAGGRADHRGRVVPAEVAVHRRGLGLVEAVEHRGVHGRRPAVLSEHLHRAVDGALGPVGAAGAHRVVLGARAHRVSGGERQGDVEARVERLARVTEGHGHRDIAGLHDVDRRPHEDDGEDRAEEEEEALPRAGAEVAGRGPGPQHADLDERADEGGREALPQEAGERRVGLDLAGVPDHPADRHLRRRRLAAPGALDASEASPLSESSIPAPSLERTS